MEKLASALDILIGAGALQGFFLSGILIAGRKRSGSATIVLALLMALFSLAILNPLVFQGMGDSFSPRERVLYAPLQFLFGPLIYFYVRALSGKGRKPAWRDILHLFPFLFLTMPFVFKPVTDAVYPRAGLWNLLLWGGAIVQLFAYLVATAHAVSLHDRTLRNLSSTQEGDLAWIKSFLAVFVGISLIDFFLLAWTIHGPDIPYFSRIQSLVLSLAVYGLGFRALLRPPASIVESDKYGRSGIGREESDQIAFEIAAYMEREKPYLDPELSLPELARRSGIARNQLSQALNESLGKNFYDFVNGYRVLEFKRLATEAGRAGDKILSLALDAGFSSKPAFNLIFKKSCGLTPSAFRASLRS
jgi:AraC-like DNA-binding protein